VLAAFGGFSLITRLTIDYSVLFTALATMHIMITPLLTLVQMLPVFISSFVSVNRLRRYINYSSPQKPKGIQCVSDGPLLSFTNAVFGWDPEKPILSGMNLNLCSGEVLSISGPTNSGKSTIMNAVLGEAELLSGNMQTGTKKISYCSQKNWFIPGLSIRDTITLGKQFDIQLYNRIVKGCCLDKDILTLQLGDDAILDNTGAPLSGGQQKRVALARALYHEPDLLLLDEVLTGLDATTLRQVVDNLFGHDGIVKRSGRMGVLMVSTECKSNRGVVLR
jgi:ABC-type multidrug transport system fused ATPase/permease subunit